MNNTLLEHITYNGISIDINIHHTIVNEFKDEHLNKIIQEINNTKDIIFQFLNDVKTNNDTYNLRKRTVSNIDITKSNLINSYILYQGKLLEYHMRLDYLKSNCIRNNDYLVELYNDTKKQLNLLNIEHDNLKLKYDKLNNDNVYNENKLKSFGIEQSVKLDALHSELTDVKTQRDFLKGLIKKNKHIIFDLEQQLNEKINELEKLNIENNKNNHQIQNYAYEIEKILNDRKYIIDNNVTLREEFNKLKTDLQKTINQSEINRLKFDKLQMENKNLEKYISNRNSEHDKNICEINLLLQNKQNEKIKIIDQLNDLLPNYTWDEKYGFISKEYDIINE